MPQREILTGFPPVLAAKPKVLILGSMPGGASLQAHQYYAHPRNAFWPVMQALFQIDAGLAYDERLKQLKATRIALWDVVHQCHRSGSLDTAIEADSVVVNDIAGLLQRNASITAVFCNGGGAWQLLHRHFLRPAAANRIRVPVYKMPSTSPANARLSLQQKCIEWQLLKQAVES